MLLLVAMVSFASNMLAPENISGTVFRDFNANGVKDPDNVSFSEVGFPGVTVTAYNSSNVAVGTTTSAADGTYSLLVDMPVRLEFTGLPSNYSSSFAGPDSKTNVQFYAAATSTANYGVIDPEQYSQSNPTIITAAQGNGARSGHTDHAVYGITNSATLTSGSVTGLQTISSIGSVWGLAYDSRNNIVYSSAFLKRHAEFGPQGIGGLYWGRYAATGLTNTGSANLNTLTSNAFGADPRASGGNLSGVGISSPSKDLAAYQSVGKRGIGDIDISADGKTLYVVNLNARTLEAFNVSAVPAGGNPTYLGSYTISNPGCNNTNDYRPFAVKVVSPDIIYVGVTCTAETSANRTDLLAFVCKIVPSAGFAAASTVIPINDNDATLPTSSYYTTGIQPPPAPPANAIPLYYNRSFQNASNTQDNHQFQAWTDTWPGSSGFISAPQPLLSNIEINRKGDLVLGIMDRMGHRTGYLNYDSSPSNTSLQSYYSYGDILYTKNTGTAGSPVYYLEGTTQNPSTHNLGDGTYQASILQGPGSGGNEYFDDHTNTGPHSENTQGGIAILPNENYSVSTVMDPHGTFQTFTNGVTSYNNANGSLLQSKVVLPFATSNFGKAAGMGDVEVLNTVAPIQIGNRVWMDTNKNGIQDADETTPGILVGITVTLRSPGPDGNYTTTGDNQSWTTTTDVNGNYYFSTLNTKDTRSPVGITTNTVLPDFEYRIEIGVPSGGYSISPADASSNSLDNIDSDAVLIGTNATVTFNTGVTNHNYDFGFFFDCPVFSNASAAQTICAGATGSDITINTTSNIANGVRFLRYSTDQTATNGSETSGELAAIYAGGTTLTTVTPSGVSAPYTATYVFNTANFPNTGNTPITYYIYAIANPDMGASCRPVQEILVTVDPAATAEAGTNMEVCQTSPMTPIILTGASIGGSASTGAWSITSATGSMTTSASQLSSTSQTTTPSTITFTPEEGVSGSVTLTLTTNDPTGACPAATDTRTITITPPATAFAGADNIICAGSGYVLAGASVGGSATTGAWTITGVTGTMTAAMSQLSSAAQTTSPQAVIFTPTSGNTGTVTLTLTSNDPLGPCTAAASTVTLTVSPPATVSAGTSQSVVIGGSVTLAGTIGGSANSATWSAPSGNFSDASSLTSTYTPSITSGTVTLTLTTNDPDGPCSAATSTVVITVLAPPVYTVDQLAATCTGLTSNNNGSIRIIAQTNGTKYGISTLNAAAYDGPSFGSASNLAGALPVVVKSNVPNAGGTYIVRVYNTASVFTDETVTVNPVICSNYCPTSTVTSLIPSGNDNARQTGTDVGLNPPGIQLYQRYQALRFTNVNIPKNATIANAYIQFTSSGSWSGVSGVVIKAHAADNSSQVTAGAASSDISNKFNNAATTSSVTWTNTTPWTDGASGADQRTPNISSVLQEIVARPGWATNNPIHILMNANTPTSGPTARAYSTGSIPQLVITYEVTTTITNPSVTQTLCAGSAGSNITVNTNQNISSSVRFMKFTSDQIAGATPTPSEMSAIYAGTNIATVTPTGVASPYTATYNWNTADFPNATNTPITYYVYAVLNPEPGAASCNPVEEIQVIVSPCKVNLGNRVWNDKDNDGIQDATEVGMAGVTVNLYTDLDNNGIADLPAILTTTTDTDGMYLFDNLTPGKYIVGVVNPAGNFVKSTTNGGNPDTNPADNDNNGVTTVSGITYSDAFVLSVGNEPLAELPNNNQNASIEDNSSNLTVDFGFYDPSALPVTLIKFTAKSEKAGTVTLNWSTSEEVNNSHFLIERSFNAVDFEEIGRLDGRGTGKSIKAYQFDDNTAHPELNYYRLIQVDFDGTATYSRIVSVRTETEVEFTTYPNPASEKINIKTDLSKVKTIKVYDLNGRLLLSPAVTSSIDVKTLGEGLYVIEIIRKDGSNSVSKFVIKK